MKETRGNGAVADPASSSDRQFAIAALHRYGYSVRFRDSFDAPTEGRIGRCYGETHYDDKTVIVCVGDRTKQEVDAILWHELNHVRGERCVEQTEEERFYHHHCGDWFTSYDRAYVFYKWPTPRSRTPRRTA